MYWLLAVAALTTGSMLMAPVEAQPPPSASPVDYAQLLRELQPRMMFEFTEANLNRYFTNHPELYQLPEGFSAGQIAFSDGRVEVSALTKVLFVPTRVRVSMEPEVLHGRLRLSVRSIHAGALRLPSSFHRGASETIAKVVNDFLDLNGVELVSVCAAPGFIRITAQAAAPPPPTPAAP